MPRYQLTPALEQTIIAYIRAGGFPHVAAEAAGIPADVFRDWLARGDAPGAEAQYRHFASAVREAAAQARLKLEVEAHNKRPLDWLKSGPGRQTAESEGWTVAARAPAAEPTSSTLMLPEVQRLIADVLAALEPFPEARAAVAAVLEKISQDSASNRPQRRSSQA
jgi:hypothetical protein